MGKSLNKVLLLGNVTRDPKIKAAGRGALIAGFSIATNERQKDSQGNWQDKPEYHSITAFGRTAEIVFAYVKKGSKVYVEGRIANESWEENGVKHSLTKIIVNEIVLLSGKAEGTTAKTESTYDSNEIDDSDLPC